MSKLAFNYLEIAMLDERKTEINLCKTNYDELLPVEQAIMDFTFEIEGKRHVVSIAMPEYLKLGKLNAYRAAYHEAVEILLSNNEKDFV